MHATNTVTALRWAAVVVGLAGWRLIFLNLPTSEINLFPDAMVLFAAIAACSLVLLWGMLVDSREGALGPLLAGTTGAIALLLFARSETGISPHWPTVLCMVAGIVALSLLRPKKH